MKNVMKLLLTIPLFLFFGCKKEQALQPSSVKGCYIDYQAKHTKVEVHHYIYFDSNGNSYTELVSGNIWITADKIRIQTSAEARCQKYTYDPSTQVYTFNGAPGACSTDYDISIGSQFVELTIPPNTASPSAICYIKIVGHII